MGRVKELQIEAHDICNALWEKSPEDIIAAIQAALNVSLSFATSLYENYCDKLMDTYDEGLGFEDDGDALASAGFGTDEDYGLF